MGVADWGCLGCISVCSRLENNACSVVEPMPTTRWGIRLAPPTLAQVGCARSKRRLCLQRAAVRSATDCLNNCKYVGHRAAPARDSGDRRVLQTMCPFVTVRDDVSIKIIFKFLIVKELAKRFQEFQETPATRLLKSSKSAAEGIMNTMDSYAEEELDIDTAKKLSAILKDVSGIIKSLDMAMK